MNNFSLENYNCDNNYWCKGKLIGTSGKEDYIIEDIITNKTNIFKPNEIRLIINSIENENFKNVNFLTSDEYLIKSNAFTPCDRKNQKGSFWSIDIKNKDNIYVTRLAREQELRTVNYIFLNEAEKMEIFKNIIIEISNEFKDWDKKEGFKDLVNNLSETFPASGNNFTFLNIINDIDDKNYLRFVSSKDDSESIKLMIEITLENESRLLKIDNEKPIASPTTIPDSISLEQIENNTIKHYISKDLAGLLIGIRGANIVKIKKYYNVDIFVKSDIPGDKVLITITGKDEEGVRNCLREVNLVKLCYEISYNKESKLKFSLQDSMNRYNLYKIHISKEKNKDIKKGAAYVNYLNIIGPEENVSKALEELKEYLII